MKLRLDRATARKIVEAGTEARGCVQTVKKTERGRSLPEASTSAIIFATVSAAWTQNSTRDAPISATKSGGGAITVYSPLSKLGDILPIGTKILVFGVGANYYLLNAECPF